MKTDRGQDIRKIAIVIFDITVRSGTERAVCNLANLLAGSLKYLVTIISVHSISGETAYNINNAVRLHHLGLSQYDNKISRLKLYVTLINKIDQICIREKISVILGTTHALNCFLFFLRKKLKIIACEHLNYMSAPLFSRLIRKIVYLFLDFVVVLTLADAKYYSSYKNIRVIPNSLSFVPNKRSELINKKILAVGRLTHQKGFDLLIKSVFFIKCKCEGWQIRIIGSGEDEDKLKKQIKILNLENIIEICPPTNAIMQEYLEASIFVLSSRFEGLPMVMIEAQSCGLPIVSFDCPEGPANIIHHNEDGLLVENGKIDKFSYALIELMDDQEKRIQFGKKALENVNRYKAENVFTMWDTLFDKLFFAVEA